MAELPKPLAPPVFVLVQRELAFLDGEAGAPLPCLVARDCLIGAAGIDGQVEHVMLENAYEMFVLLDQFLEDVIVG